MRQLYTNAGLPVNEGAICKGSSLILGHPDRRTQRNTSGRLRKREQLLNESALVSVREGLANEFNASAQLMGTKNQIEAVVAKLQRRAPQFDDPRDVD